MVKKDKFFKMMDELGRSIKKVSLKRREGSERKDEEQDLKNLEKSLDDL